MESTKKIACRTTIPIRQLDFAWTIDNFETYKQFPIESPSFHVQDNYKCYLRLSKFTNNYSLACVRLFDVNVEIEVDTSILGADKNCKTDLRFNCDTTPLLTFVWAVKNGSQKNEMFPTNCLSIKCSFRMKKPAVNILNTCTTDDRDGLIRDFEKLLANSKLSDFNIRIGEKCFQAHKSVLAARSKTMAEFLELNKVDEITIDYTTPEVFKFVLDFIYTGEFKGNGKEEEVLSVAVKLGISNLKMLCEEILSTTIRTKHAPHLLKLAYSNDCNYLKQNLLHFINIKRDEVFKTESWNSLICNRDDIVIDVLNNLCGGSIRVRQSWKNEDYDEKGI